MQIFHEVRTSLTNTSSQKSFDSSFANFSTRWRCPLNLITWREGSWTRQISESTTPCEVFDAWSMFWFQSFGSERVSFRHERYAFVDLTSDDATIFYWWTMWSFEILRGILFRGSYRRSVFHIFHVMTFMVRKKAEIDVIVNRSNIWESPRVFDTRICIFSWDKVAVFRFKIYFQSSRFEISSDLRWYLNMWILTNWDVR